MEPGEFRALGYWLVDRIAEFLGDLRERAVTAGESPAQVRAVLGRRPLPERGAPASEILEEAWRLLERHSLFNGHPRFAGYVTSSAAPIGALADLLAAALNPNAGAWILSPMATEIEAETVRWIAEFLGYPASCGGLLVSGGNMANFVGFLAARRAKGGSEIRSRGAGAAGHLLAYASTETHTWLQKAADLFGLGTDSLRWIPTGRDFRIDLAALREAIKRDRDAGHRPFLLVGSTGTVGTGAVDPLPAMVEIAREHCLWFHVDGAYGAPAAALSDASADLKGLHEADSLAVDPHKWFYAPLEAGCVLVRDPQHLPDTFDYSPAYYRFQADAEERPVNYYAQGPQNSRGFRALKVWMGLQAAGREGLIRMIADDIELAKAMYREAQSHPELEALAQGLSITAFRYVPAGVDCTDPAQAERLNRLNEVLLDRIQKSGEGFLSNAIVEGKFALRLCIVNFRTTAEDVKELVKLVVMLGREVSSEQDKSASAAGGEAGGAAEGVRLSDHGGAGSGAA